MSNPKFGVFVKLVVETINDCGELGTIPASSVTMACESAGFCSNMEAFDMLRTMHQLEIIKYTGHHSIEKGPKFAVAEAMLKQVSDMLAKGGR